ncbi:MAG: hypothetical protein QM286_02425 [Acidobacteriota bacterium]|nr:hypothetical protein [Acidobacteriota bacterium]
MIIDPPGNQRAKGIDNPSDDALRTGSPQPSKQGHHDDGDCATRPQLGIKLVWLPNRQTPHWSNRF